MGQEFFINSQELENKVRDLLPSQGGSGAGFDLSASTQIIPIIDLTESAEGSNLRSDLQTSFDNATSQAQANDSTVTAISNTGFYKVNVDVICSSGGNATIDIYDGASATVLRSYLSFSALNRYFNETFNVFLSAGLVLRLTTSNAGSVITTHSRQIANIEGGLTNPLAF